MIQADATATPPLDLVLIMPVYNEQECIARVVTAWREELARTVGPGFLMLVLNDGSRDGTARELERFASDPAIEVRSKPNSGHGPTILLGYGEAVERAPWVAHVDSDDEISPAHSARLWQHREGFDAVLGVREGRAQGLARRIVSFTSRAAVRILFAGGVRDVNVPYRLLRSDVLRAILPAIPPDTFAPNVIISGLLGAGGARIANLPVPHQGRTTGVVSISSLRLWRVAARALAQTLRIALTSRQARRRIAAAVAACSRSPPSGTGGRSSTPT